MHVKSTSMRIGKDSQEQESVVTEKNYEESIEEWADWFRRTLLEAFKKGEDVEILVGRKPNKTNDYTV